MDAVVLKTLLEAAFHGTPSVKLLCFAKAALLRRPRRFSILDHRLTCPSVDQDAACSESPASGGEGSHVAYDVKRQDLPQAGCHGVSSAATHNVDAQWRAHGDMPVAAVFMRRCFLASG